MKISAEQVQHLARLARLRLTPEEQEKYQKDLSHILTFVGQLQEVDTASLGDMVYTTPLQNVSRKDEVAAADDPENLIAQFPESEDRALKVDAIF